MKICMLGTGSLGSTIGGTLAQGGSEVYFVDQWKEHIDKINEMLKDCAMSTVNTLYLDPSDSMKEKMLEESDPFMASLVTYKVSYAGEGFEQ